EWHTAHALTQILQARLNLRYKLTHTPERLELSLLSPRAMHRFGLVLFTTHRGNATIGEQQMELAPAEYYGYPCLALETDLVEKTVREIQLFEASRVAVA
ncbi:MAG: hypothetical protein P3X24_007460, partial [bacterium]|nr:hypothetical protein [bacterium]